ncbi:MAG: hypothetical protein R2748_06875 [Bryobacterales bacterium]
MVPFAPRLTSDGKRAILVDYDDKRAFVSDADFQTGRRAITATGDEIGPVLFSHDDRFALFVRMAEKGLRDAATLWAIDLESPDSEPRQVADLGEDLIPWRLWTDPTGRLFFGRSRPEVTRTVMVGAGADAPQEETAVQSELASGTFPLFYSSDGQALYYRRMFGEEVTEHASVLRRDLGAGRDEEISLPVPPRSVYGEAIPGLRRDLEKIAYVRGGAKELAVFDVRTETSSTVVEWPYRIFGLGGAPFRMDWSPAGDKIAFVAQAADERSYTLNLANVESGQAVTLVDRLQFDAPLAFSPDGASIAYADADCLWVIAANGGEARKLNCVEPLVSPPRDSWRGSLAAEVWGGAGPSWSPDGTRLAWATANAVSKKAELLVVDTKTGTTKVVWSGKPDLADWARLPHWSPSGDQIAIAVSEGRDCELWTLENYLPDQGR